MKEKVIHWQPFYGDLKSFCGRASLYIGDHKKDNSTWYHNSVTCKHCKAATGCKQKGGINHVRTRINTETAYNPFA